MSSTSRCRSCGAEIIWVEMRDSKRKNPINPTPHEDGNIVIVGNTGIALKWDERAHYIACGFVFYKSHFATCQNADKHRKKVLSAHKQQVMDSLGGRPRS